MSLWTDLNEVHPWLSQIGLSAKWFQQVTAQTRDPSEVLAEIRATPQWKRRFSAIRDAGGQMRMTEAEYMQTERDYRRVLARYGVTGYNDPQSLIGFFESDQDPNEVADRLELWNEVKTSGQQVKDTFYVYAGMNITNDDLYESLVDDSYEQALKFQYNANKAKLAFDYRGWIARAHKVGNDRAAGVLAQLQKQGALTGVAVQRVLGTDPTFARQIMSAIYKGGDMGGGAGTLPLEALLKAWEFAAVGAAAKEAGLEMPSLQRLSEIRAAGVDRAKAIEGYQSFGKSSAIISAAVQRVRGKKFTQTMFESAQFLGNAANQRLLEEGLASEEAAGRSQGQFRFSEAGGRLVQSGFSRY